eukprot:TRINITY_DN9291_c0_g2_i1.p1 TRINITY_DN9291_c0_g2~~TRINITY_DN9291_c0_g2_i1.p1  ORF type:complete len:861 (-),score=96.95 TRINITY_DN9291_c0_g2_i1:1392-3893(-)
MAVAPNNSSEAIRVVVRIRPCPASALPGTVTVVPDPERTYPRQLVLNDITGRSPRITKFSYHAVFNGDTAPQEAIFEYCGRAGLQSALDGFNTSILAYGQTGSGKTFTMLGDSRLPGLIPRLLTTLFDQTRGQKQTNVTLSFLEIYNEKVRDLLQTDAALRMQALRVRQHPTEGPFVDGLRHVVVTDAATALRWINVGSKERTVAATRMNDLSSRSHAIVQVAVTQTEVSPVVAQNRRATAVPLIKRSRVQLVDLAGSERVGRTNAIGETFKEGNAINQSLLTLRQVIDVLVENQGHKGRAQVPPYRQSVLTWLLSDSLGGSARTILIATISALPVNYEETAGTLRYAQRATAVINTVRVNVEDSRTLLVRQLQDHIAMLEAKLEEVKTDGTPREMPPPPMDDAGTQMTPVSQTPEPYPEDEGNYTALVEQFLQREQILLERIAESQRRELDLRARSTGMRLMDHESFVVESQMIPPETANPGAVLQQALERYLTLAPGSEETGSPVNERCRELLQLLAPRQPSPPHMESPRRHYILEEARESREKLRQLEHAVGSVEFESRVRQLTPEHKLRFHSSGPQLSQRWQSESGQMEDRGPLSVPLGPSPPSTCRTNRSRERRENDASAPNTPRKPQHLPSRERRERTISSNCLDPAKPSASRVETEDDLAPLVDAPSQCLSPLRSPLSLAKDDRQSSGYLGSLAKWYSHSDETDDTASPTLTALPPVIRRPFEAPPATPLTSTSVVVELPAVPPARPLVTRPAPRNRYTTPPTEGLVTHVNSTPLQSPSLQAEAFSRQPTEHPEGPPPVLSGHPPCPHCGCGLPGPHVANCRSVLS